MARDRLRRAGIDADGWRPEDGLLENDAIVQAVYRYYGDLYLDHPELQWAGMANIVGPMFYAGWQDMYAIRQIADPAERAEYLSRWVGLPRSRTRSTTPPTPSAT